MPLCHLIVWDLSGDPPHSCCYLLTPSSSLSSPFLHCIPRGPAAGRRASLVIFLLQFALNALGAAGGLPLIAVVTPHQAELGLREGRREGGAEPPSRVAGLEQGPTLFSLGQGGRANMAPPWTKVAPGLLAGLLHSVPDINTTLTVPSEFPG